MKVVILVGSPGSGKSTLCRTEFADYIRISQDDLGSKEACLKLFNESLSANKNCIIDRCNVTVGQRREWINIAQLFGATVQAVYLQAEPTLCVKRLSTRHNHPTISTQTMSIDKMRVIVRKFNNDTEIPTLDEHFSSVLHIRVRN